MTTEAKRRGHQHPEAFALMQYTSKSSGITEIIWNSRDGVTPFGIRMRDGTEGNHVNWDQDRYAPNHVPQLGDRIFVNLTLDTARRLRREYVDKYWESGVNDFSMSDMYESKDEAIESLAQADFSSFGEGTTPHLIEVDSAFLASMLSHRVPFYPTKYV